jgi:hypothetical protein
MIDLLRRMVPANLSGPSKSSSDPDSHLKGFDRVENICKCRCSCRRYPGSISVVNIVIVAAKQVREFDRPPMSR